MQPLPALTYEPSYLKYGAGHLHVFTQFSGGTKVAELFTFRSLADVLGMSQVTLQGRYVRGRLHIPKVDIRTGAGRPLRGFHLHQLDEIIKVVKTPGAFWSAPAPAGSAKTPAPAKLVPVTIDGQPWHTVESMAQQLGVSVSTVRNKLARAGLDAEARPTATHTLNGRPRMGYPVPLGAELIDAITGNHKTTQRLDREPPPEMREQLRSVAQPPLGAPVNSVNHAPVSRLPVTPAAPLVQYLAPNGAVLLRTPTPADMKADVENTQISNAIIADIEGFAAQMPDYVPTQYDSAAADLPPARPQSSTMDFECPVRGAEPGRYAPCTLLNDVAWAWLPGLEVLADPEAYSEPTDATWTSRVLSCVKQRKWDVAEVESLKEQAREIALSRWQRLLNGEYKAEAERRTKANDDAAWASRVADIERASHSHDTPEPTDVLTQLLEANLTGLTTDASTPPPESDYAVTLSGLLEAYPAAQARIRDMLAQARAYWQQRMGGAA